MPDERISKLERRHNAFEQWGWKTVSAIGMALIVWYLNGINGSLRSLSDDIVNIKLSDSANNQKMDRLNDDVLSLKVDSKEIIKRVTTLEKISEKHEHQLKRWDK